LKDLLTQKEALIPLAESPEVSLDLFSKPSDIKFSNLKFSDHGVSHVRRSAAMLGLAISMGTASMSAAAMLFTQHKATAANSIPPSSSISTVTLPLGVVSNTVTHDALLRTAQISLLKSELKAGESVKKLPEIYNPGSKVFLSANTFTSPSNSGIPNSDRRVAKNTRFSEALENPKALPPTQLSNTSPRAIADTPEFETALAHLRETRKRLQEGLSEIQYAKATTSSDEIDAQIQSDDVSQPLQTTDNLVTSSSLPAVPLRSNREAEQNSLLSSPSVEIPPYLRSAHKLTPPNSLQQTQTLAATTLLENGFSHPIPIPVPTPESVMPQAVIPVRRLTAPQPLAVPATGNQAGNQSPASGPQKAEGISNFSDPSLAAFNQPIALPVPTPASQMNIPTQMPSQMPRSQSPTAAPQSLPIQPSERPNTTADQTYQVRPGDTLNSIARLHGLTIDTLIRANQITNPNVITVSQNLVIPSSPSALPAQPLAIADKSSFPTIAPVMAALPSAQLPVIQAQEPVSQEPIANADQIRQPIAVMPVANTPVADKVIKVNSRSSQLSNLSPSGINLGRTDTERLKADISNLEETYGHPLSRVSIPVVQPPVPETVSSVSDGGDAVDPEWQSDRKTFANQRRSPQLPVLSRPSSTHSKNQIIGAAPINVQEYNNNLQIPVGQEVSPELPPLSDPDHYLPDAPMQASGYIWPAKGVLTSGYGWRWGRMHKGIDIAAPIGTPVFAAAPGEVISAGWNSGGYGNLVKILHADGSITVYAHNSRILVQQGQRVEQGEQISAMGSTGFSTGPHLHFEVHPSGKSAVNPIAYLPSKGKNL